MTKGLTLHKEVWWRGYTQGPATTYRNSDYRGDPRVGLHSSSKASLSISSRTSTLMHLLLSLRLHPGTPRYAGWSLLASWLLATVATETVARQNLHRRDVSDGCRVITETTETQDTILKTIIRFVPESTYLCIEPPPPPFPLSWYLSPGGHLGPSFWIFCPP